MYVHVYMYIYKVHEKLNLEGSIFDVNVPRDDHK